MRLLLSTIIALTAINSCAGKKAESRQAEQPTEVSGGFGLTMQCNVLNRDTKDATSSSIGCLVFNDDGSRFTGSIAGATAEIVTSSGSVIKSTQVASGASAGSYSVGVDVSNLKPSDAATIRISANFDNSPRILVASLKGRLATTCDEDVTYYVRKDADPKNIMCTENQPCPTINRALDLLQDIINCKVTVDIGAGEFIEAIQIDTKQLSNAGSISFKGKTKEEDGQVIDRLDTTIKQPETDANYHVVLVGLKTAGSALASGVDISNIRLQGRGLKNTRAIVPRSTSIRLQNVEILDYHEGIWPSNSSSLFLEPSPTDPSINSLKHAVTISNVKSGISVPPDSQMVRFSGLITILGSGDYEDSNPKPLRSPGIGVYVQETLQFRADGLLRLNIEKFEQGFFLENSKLNLKPGQKIEISDVSYGINMMDSEINLFTSENCSPEKSEFERTISVSIKQFSQIALYLRRAIFTDAFVRHTGCNASVTLEGETTATNPTQLFTVSDSSNLALTKSTMSFCLPTTSERPWWHTPENPAIYAMSVDSASRAFFDWKNPNPFNKSSACTPTNTSIFLRTWWDSYQAGTDGADACPIGYSKADNYCYGNVGYARFGDLRFGVLQNDSRLDTLFTPTLPSAP